MPLFISAGVLLGIISLGILPLMVGRISARVIMPLSLLLIGRGIVPRMRLAVISLTAMLINLLLIFALGFMPVLIVPGIFS